MKNSKILLAVCLILCATVAFASCQKHTTDDCIDENKDHKCDVCEAEMGTHADSNKDHVCDYGCSAAIGVCEDVDTDHVCDYGCSVGIGECADEDKDHACDYGCGQAFGECADANTDHACDYGCSKTFGKCADEDKDHACDYGCSKTFGEHADGNSDHVCDYGCSVGIGECADEDKDHACDYGCKTVIGEHADANTDHVCDYGCKEAIGECEDKDTDHACDYGCSKIFGEHADGNTDHACDYGCSVGIGECADEDKDHACDYGCKTAIGEHTDADNNHVCDYGCSDAIGECEDKDTDHACDYGCSKTFGEHADGNTDHACDYGCNVAIGECSDSAEDKDHVCDYGCNKTLEKCSDVDTDDNHNCDVCGAENVTSHGYGEWEKNDESSHKQTCNCGDVVTADHQWNDGEITTPADHTNEGEKTYTCTVCSETKTETVPKLTECTYDQKNIDSKFLKTPATCEQGNIYYMSCICGNVDENNSFEDESSKLSHSEKEAVKENENAATCTADGSYDSVVYCDSCDAKVSSTTVTVPATGHQDVDGDLVCDGCDVQFYVITLDGATATAETKNFSSVSNAFVAGEQITITADAYKTVDEVKYMFVGFDLNTVDNRICDDGSTGVIYTMPAEAVSITAVYAEADTDFFNTGSFSSSNTPEGFSATAITDSTDADLEGLTGWSLVIPDNAAATTSKANNITSVKATAWGIDNEKLVRFVLKNTGNYDVTVEIYAEYFGYLVTTGNVTVPANSVVVAFMDYGPFSGAGSTVDFAIHVRENMAGDGSGTVQLDVVASLAKKYESKVSDFIVASDKDVFMDFGESTESNTQANQAHASGSGMNMRYWDEYGVMYFYGNNDTTADTYARERANAIGGNAIALKTSGTFTIYVKVTNLYHAGGGKYSLVFTRGSSTLSGNYLATQVIEFSEYGESFVYAIEIDPSIAGSSDNLQFGLKKAAADGTGGKIDVLVQIASENIFGEAAVNE